jgi:hypothetical protein
MNNSSNIQSLIPWAIERHQAGEARVIPILLRPVDWAGAPFSQLEVLPKNHQPITTWANQDEAFHEIAEGIRAVAMKVRKEEAGERRGRGSKLLIQLRFGSFRSASKQLITETRRCKSQLTCQTNIFNG